MKIIWEANFYMPENNEVIIIEIIKCKHIYKYAHCANAQYNWKGNFTDYIVLIYDTYNSFYVSYHM